MGLVVSSVSWICKEGQYLILNISISQLILEVERIHYCSNFHFLKNKSDEERKYFDGGRNL